jgi:hypothetical protein
MTSDTGVLNFPADFATLLAGHDTSNVHGHGWAGIKSGELLRRAHDTTYAKYL